jgi:glycosyltransferase involved in cell wall biosynthesis
VSLGDRRPLVTIGLPVRDAESTLPEALASIRGQSFQDWELLIVDDGSADGTAEIVAELTRDDDRVRLIADGEQRGLPTRLNQLLDLACGEVFARMDADDVAYPARLERQVALLASNPEVDLVGCSMLVFGTNGVPRGKRPAPPTHDEIVTRPHASFFPLFHPTWVGRTSWFRKYGYRPLARRCEDQDLLLRAHRRSTFANLPDILLGYREDKVRLRPTLVGRANWARSVWRAEREQSPLAVGTAVAAQAGKGLLDVAAVALRAERYLLPHRARPSTNAERQEWAEVWASVQRPTKGHDDF